MCCLLAACSGGGQSSPDFQRGMMQRQDLMSALEVLSSHPDDLMANRVVWGFYTERGEYDSVIMFAGKMFSEKSGQAMSFVDKASGEIHEFPQFVPSLYLLYAEIYAAQGIDTQAEHYYEEAVAHEDDAEPSDRVLISLRYAEFLSVRGRNAEARGCLLHGLEISRSVSSMEYRSALLTALADVSVKLGDDAFRILSDASSEIQLQDLAMEMGHNSQSSFYRAFVKETGVPPSKYREESLRIKAAC